MTQGNAENLALSHEDMLRADLYEFIGSLLRKEPEVSLIEKVAGLSGDQTDMGSAFSTLARLASSLETASIRDEYVNLFIGVGRGEVLPFASYYLTGFLHEKPLANLRADMAAMGVARADGVKDPEDHIASLMDIMAGMIRGDYGRAYSIDEQATFFNKHLAKWAGLVFRDIEAAKTAVFYAPLGTIGRLFMDIEAQGFDMGAKG